LANLPFSFGFEGRSRSRSQPARLAKRRAGPRSGPVCPRTPPVGPWPALPFQTWELEICVGLGNLRSRLVSSFDGDLDRRRRTATALVLFLPASLGTRAPYTLRGLWRKYLSHESLARLITRNGAHQGAPGLARVGRGTTLRAVGARTPGTLLGGCVTFLRSCRHPR